MSQPNLILTLPDGVITATTLETAAFARHRSPGSGKYFQHRTVLFELAMAGNAPDFKFLDEGGWRDAQSDTLGALREVTTEGKRTKTALSNNAFSCTPVDCFRRGYLAKTGGELLELELVQPVLFDNHECHEHMKPDEIAATIKQPPPASRTPRLYLVLCPVQFVVLSSLTPSEYAWYATHRPGKIFRQVAFAELQPDQIQFAAQSRYEDARRELGENPTKKTKTLTSEDAINHAAFSGWVGYERRQTGGGLCTADRNHMRRWRFPATLPVGWDDAAD